MTRRTPRKPPVPNCRTENEMAPERDVIRLREIGAFSSRSANASIAAGAFDQRPGDDDLLDVLACPFDIHEGDAAVAAAADRLATPRDRAARRYNPRVGAAARRDPSTRTRRRQAGARDPRSAGRAETAPRQRSSPSQARRSCMSEMPTCAYRCMTPKRGQITIGFTLCLLFTLRSLPARSVKDRGSHGIAFRFIRLIFQSSTAGRNFPIDSVVHTGTHSWVSNSSRGVAAGSLR